MLKITTFAEGGGAEYTESMSIFAKVTPAPVIRGDYTNRVAILYAALLAIMAVGQLFTFEDLPLLYASYNLPVDMVVVAMLPSLVVALSILALPFLLRMHLSVAFRWLSMIAGWLVAALWLGISTWVVVTNQAPETVGFIGSLGSLTPGLWAVFISVAMAILAAWSSWGMWPAVRGRDSRKKRLR